MILLSYLENYNNVHHNAVHLPTTTITINLLLLLPTVLDKGGRYF